MDGFNNHKHQTKLIIKKMVLLANDSVSNKTAILNQWAVALFQCIISMTNYV